MLGDKAVERALVFFISFIVCSIAIYVYMPYKRVIMNPTPNTTEDTIYLDDVGVCYKYKKNDELECGNPKLKYKKNIPYVYE